MGQQDHNVAVQSREEIEISPADHIHAAQDAFTLRVEQSLLDGASTQNEYNLVQYLLRLWANLSRELLTRTSLWQ
jgi:hypothetical protein